MTRDEALSVLGLDSNASDEDIRTAYRELAQMLHPDKYGSNGRLRKRAERQMTTLNEARDTLLKKSGRSSGGAGRTGAGAASHASSPGTSASAGASASVRRAAAARARAAETARLAVVAQIRSLTEGRTRALMFLLVGVIGMLILTRIRGTIRTIGFPLASGLAIWGFIDTVNIVSELGGLRRRARELLADRDAARAVANGEV